MFITKKHIPRRTFLHGAGVALALPFLESMVPAQTPLRKTAANPKTRFTGIFVPHGMAPGYWVPKTEGKGFEFPMIMKPLEPFRDQTVIMSGLWSKSAEPPPGVTGADHWVAAAFMCANKPKKTTGADIQDGTTIDQLIAQKIGQETLLPSLQLALEDPGANSSNCGEGYSCAYTNSISWSSPTQPLPMELDPQVAFERLFGSGGSHRRARRAPRTGSQHSRFRLAEPHPLQDAISARATGRVSTNTKPISAKSNAAWNWRRSLPARRTPMASWLRPAYRNRSTST